MITVGRLSAALTIAMLALSGVAAADEPQNQNQNPRAAPHAAPPPRPAPPRPAPPPAVGVRPVAPPQALMHPRVLTPPQPGAQPMPANPRNFAAPAAPPAGVQPMPAPPRAFATAPPPVPRPRVVEPPRPGQRVPAPGVAPGGTAHANAGPVFRHRFDFRGREFRSFTPQEAGIWESGHWHHGWHNGRFGWWWGLGGAWYLYDAPVYPYPEFVSPEVAFEEAPQEYYGDTTPDQAASAWWYYCYDPPGYYPYVQSCATDWQPVPAQPE